MRRSRPFIVRRGGRSTPLGLLQSCILASACSGGSGNSESSLTVSSSSGEASSTASDQATEAVTDSDANTDADTMTGSSDTADTGWDTAVVTTVQLSAAQSFDGLYMDPEGTLFGAAGWKGEELLQIAADGTIKLFASGLDGPIHLTRGGDGLYYVTAYNDGTLRRVNAEGQEMTILGEALVGPSGVVTGEDGTVYFVVWGPPQGGGETLYRVNGADEVVVEMMGMGLDTPQGLAADGAGNLYVGNALNGRVLRIDGEGEVSLLAELPNSASYNIAHMTFAGGRLIATGGLNHLVYEIALDGTVTTWGSGEGVDLDGPLSAAAFDTPAGLAASPDAKTVWISTDDPEVLRVISVE